MRGVRISYLIDYPQYVPQLAQWLFEEWDAILGEKTPEVRIKKLNAHMNRDQLPIAWVAHADGQLLGRRCQRLDYRLERLDHCHEGLSGTTIAVGHERPDCARGRIILDVG